MLERTSQLTYLSQSQANQLIQMLLELVGPIAPILVQHELEDCTSLPQLLAQIEQWIPDRVKSQFQQQSAALVETQ